MNFKPGTKVVIVKPEPGAHSAVMETYVGRTLTFDRWASGPGGVCAYCEETGEVPFAASWVKLYTGQSLVWGYDHQKKEQVVFQFSDRLLYEMNRTRRDKKLENCSFRVTREDTQHGPRDRITAVEKLPNPWPKQIGNYKDHLLTLFSGGENGLKQGEIHVIFSKAKIGQSHYKPSFKEQTQKLLGTEMTTYREATPTQAGKSESKPDDCNCTGRDLLFFGHKCGRGTGGKR